MFTKKQDKSDFWTEIKKTQEQVDFATTLRLLQVCHEEGLSVERAIKAFNKASAFLVKDAPVPDYQKRYEAVIEKLKQE